MKSLSFLLLLSAFILSCGSAGHTIFGKKKTPHEKYEEKLEDAGLDDTPLGRQWKAASEKALLQPEMIQLPYRMQGYFPADKPRALGLSFHVRQGEQIVFGLTKKMPGFIIYADLFNMDGSNSAHLLSADIDSTRFSFDATQTGEYIIRLQPQLSNSGEYDFSISTGPSLGFPVSGNKARTGSFWGDDRDGGKRRHEGIDIFAPKLTPAVAAADGYITGANEEGLGGKTVWLRVTGKNYSLYYAHLDKQLVSAGQFVKKGDVVGLVGNTGNAKSTPSHLHFGVYTYGGPVDPFPFVNNTVKSLPSITAKELTGYLKLIKAQKLPGGNTAEAHILLIPLAVTPKGYIAELPDGSLMQTSFASVKRVEEKDQQQPKPMVTTPRVSSKRS